jgi:hypothetical protein
MLYRFRASGVFAFRRSIGHRLYRAPVAGEQGEHAFASGFAVKTGDCIGDISRIRDGPASS